MRISDWSSDVCSSDLLEILGLVDRFAVGLHDAIGGAQHQLAHADALEVEVVADHLDRRRHHVGELHLADAQSAAAAGRAEPAEKDRKSTRLKSSPYCASRMPSSACKTQHLKSNTHHHRLHTAH